MESNQDDGWLRQLARKEVAPPVPSAAVADRVLTKVRSMEMGSVSGWRKRVSVLRRYRSDDLVYGLVISLATTTAVWLAWLAFPAWQDLSSPHLSVRFQLADALTLRR